jgi:hypothetical protein
MNSESKMLLEGQILYIFLKEKKVFTIKELQHYIKNESPEISGSEITNAFWRLEKEGTLIIDAGLKIKAAKK